MTTLPATIGRFQDSVIPDASALAARLVTSRAIRTAPVVTAGEVRRPDTALTSYATIAPPGAPASSNSVAPVVPSTRLSVAPPPAMVSLVTL